MSRLPALVLAVLIGAVPVAALADMTLPLRDGRTITVPAQPQDAAPGFSFDARLETSPPTLSPPAAQPAAPQSAAPPPAVPQTQAQAPQQKDDPFAPPVPRAVPAIGTSSGPVTPIPQPPAQHQSGRVLHVGPGRELKTPSAAEKQAKDGDVIEIDAADYIGDVVSWKENDLTVRGIGGRAHLEADGNAAEGKAIWVTNGRNMRIENIEFSGAKVGDGNGAGIRVQAPDLTVVNCYFHDNQEGILTTNSPDSDIFIEGSGFVHNGTPSGQVHGIYIGEIRNLVVRGSVFQATVIGHHIKTRAHNNYILYNRILDYADGSASYSIDFSNGGRAYVIGNVMQKSAKADNYNFIAFAMEGPTNPDQELFVVGNTMVLDRSSGVFVHSRASGPVLIEDNILAGPGLPTQGARATLINNLIANPNGDTPDGLNDNGSRGNKLVRDAGFVDRAKYDYHLAPGSPAIGAGADPGIADGVRLAPDMQNHYPLGAEPRPAATPPDIGAYRFSASK